MWEGAQDWKSKLISEFKKKKKRILRGNCQKLLKSSVTENFQDKRENKLNCKDKERGG